MNPTVDAASFHMEDRRNHPHIRGPLHLSNIYNTVTPQSTPTNVVTRSVIRLSEAATEAIIHPTPAGEDTKERRSRIREATEVVVGPTVVTPMAHIEKSTNEVDIILRIPDIGDDDDYFHHQQKGYVHPVTDDLQDAVSVLSDDRIFDDDQPSLLCGRCRTQYLLLLSICIITATILAGVCVSGNCGSNNTRNINNGTSLVIDDGDDSTMRPTDNPLSSSPSFLVPTARPQQAPQSLPTVVLLPTTIISISEPPSMSPTHEEIIPRQAFTSTQELYDAVDAYLSTGISNPVYGKTISSWNISLLTNLSNVFNAFDRNPLAFYFNANLSRWDTSRVTTMENLFLDARTFNGDVSTWQTNNVINMHEMFGRAISFNGDISNWDTSKVTTIKRMFARVTNFNGNLRRWNVSSVEDMSFAFTNCLSFQGLGLDAWDTSRVRSMEGMFLNTPSFNGDLSLWNVSRVTNMKKTFRQATSFNSVLSQWDVDNVTDMTEMFMHALSFNGDISSWNVSSVEYAPLAFYGASSFRADLSNWNVSKMKDVTKMFAAAKSQHHNYCRWGQVLPGDAITQSLFIASGCPIPIDPSHTFAATRLTYCTSCANILNSTTAPTASPSLSAPQIPLTGSFIPILSNVELLQAVDAYLESGTSSNAAAQYGYPISTWDVSLVKDFSFVFASERNIKARQFNDDIGSWNTSSAVSMAFMFAGAALFNQDISFWSTGKVVNMTGMFMGADLFNGDLSGWDTSSVTDMSIMFQSALMYLGRGLSNWDTSNVTSLFATFEEAGSFINNISTWDTSKVINMHRTFQYASSFNGDISDWNVSNVESFSYAFSGASSFNRDLSSWDVSSAQSMIGMFSSAKAFNNNLCSWGPLLNLTLVPSGNLTRGVFTSSACLDTRDPNIVSISQGPFCHDCLL